MSSPYPFLDWQEKALLITERVASGLSIAGCLFVLITFFSSSKFRRPVNRLIFYATWGNLLMNIATMTSLAGINAGQNSALCQFQGFLIQMFLPADALWNLSMAINVYLTVFKKYNAAQLRAREVRYHMVNYGLTFVVAFSYCFINTYKGKIYGPAVLWCWISAEWDVLRIGLCYGPAWFAILISFCIYVMAGREIYRKRSQLRSFRNQPDQDINPPVIENPFTSFKTTEIQVTSELAQRFSVGESGHTSQQSMGVAPPARHDKNYEQYTIKIERGPRVAGASNLNNAAMEANAAAWGYTKCAMLFFASLLITWVPSSAFRVWLLVHPGKDNFPLAFVAGLVLPLMGFWNTVIYITTSWSAVRNLFEEDLGLRRSFVRFIPDGSKKLSVRGASSVGNDEDGVVLKGNRRMERLSSSVSSAAVDVAAAGSDRGGNGEMERERGRSEDHSLSESLKGLAM